jgi:hypothetical protein
MKIGEQYWHHTSFEAQTNEVGNELWFAHKTLKKCLKDYHKFSVCENEKFVYSMKVTHFRKDSNGRVWPYGIILKRYTIKEAERILKLSKI